MARSSKLTSGAGSGSAGPSHVPRGCHRSKFLLTGRGIKTDKVKRALIKMARRQLQSDYIYKAMKSILNHQENGKYAGFLEGWKSIPLVIQLLFSLGSKGLILPNNSKWASGHIKCNVKHKKELICPEFIVKKAIVTILELFLCLKSHSISVDNRE